MLGLYFFKTYQREMLMLMRNPQLWIQPLLFFALVIFLFSFVFSTQTAAQYVLLPFYIWLGALLAQLLAMDGLFKQDYIDGSLDNLLQAPSMPLVVVAKLLPHLLFNLVPLLALTLLLSFIWQFDAALTAALVVSLLLGLPLLFLIGSLGAALTVPLRASSLLTALILLPFYVPILILALSAVQAAALGFAWQGQMSLLAAYFIMVCFLAPMATAGILKVTAAR